MRIEIDTTKNKTEHSKNDILAGLAARKSLWDKLPPDKRKDWQQNKKEPVIYEAYQLFKQLKSFFNE